MGHQATSTARLPGYRSALRRLDRQSTPEPWSAEGSLYGVTRDGAFRPLGFAPHRPSDARLVAAYRSAVVRLVEALDALERLMVRAQAREPNAGAVGTVQILDILDGLGEPDRRLRAHLADLDSRTTPPPWDPGHLVIGMEVEADAAELGIARPAPSDPHLIAAARWAVPRALGVLDEAERRARGHGSPNGHLDAAGVEAVLRAVRAFDAHDVEQGYGTGTV